MADLEIGMVVRPIHRYAFRAGHPAVVVAEGNYEPNGLPVRDVWVLRFNDGRLDLVPKSETWRMEQVTL